MLPPTFFNIACNKQMQHAAPDRAFSLTSIFRLLACASLIYHVYANPRKQTKFLGKRKQKWNKCIQAKQRSAEADINLQITKNSNLIVQFTRVNPFYSVYKNFAKEFQSTV